MRGGVPRYAAQATTQFDADSAVAASALAKSAIAEKGHLWMETTLESQTKVLLAVQGNSVNELPQIDHLSIYYSNIVIYSQL